jgi:hypothetical protein
MLFNKMCRPSWWIPFFRFPQGEEEFEEVNLQVLKTLLILKKSKKGIHHDGLHILLNNISKFHDILFSSLWELFRLRITFTHENKYKNSTICTIFSWSCLPLGSFRSKCHTRMDTFVHHKFSIHIIHVFCFYATGKAIYHMNTAVIWRYTFLSSIFGEASKSNLVNKIHRLHPPLLVCMCVCFLFTFILWKLFLFFFSLCPSPFWYIYSRDFLFNSVLVFLWLVSKSIILKTFRSGSIWINCKIDNFRKMPLLEILKHIVQNWKC